MKIHLLIFVILPVFAVDYLKLIEEGFDENISPCDNLYRYVCPINEKKFFLEVIFEEYKKDIDQYEIPEKYVEMKELYEQMNIVYESQEVDAPFMTDIVNKLEQRCLNSRDEYAHILQNLETLVKNKILPCYSAECFSSLLVYDDCHEAASILQVSLKSVFLDWSLNFLFIPAAIEVFKSYQWYENNKHAYDRLNNTVTIIKSFASQLISTTPWIKNRNATKIYETIANQLILLDPLQYKKVNEIYLDEYSAKIEKCHLSLNESFLTPLCYLRAAQTTFINEPFLFWSNSFNAFNAHPFMGINNPFVYIAGLDLPPAYFLGSVAQVLAHEVGHTYIVSAKGDNNLPYFPNETRSCIQNQFEKSCQYFDEGGCETNDDKFEEDGADIFAYEMMYEILKFVYGNNLNDLVEGTTKNTTNLQLFFLGPSTTSCEKIPLVAKASHVHHASHIRENSVAAQNSDFAKTFNCPNDSKMVQSMSEKCNILGENAAITR